MQTYAVSKLTPNDIIPPDLWGRDHFSALLYIETRIVDGGSRTFQIALDPHMRTNMHNYQEFAGRGGAIHLGNEQTRKNKASMVRVMQAIHGSRLSDGTYVLAHDDWQCIADMADIGYFASAGKLINADDLQRGVQITLSTLGQSVAARCRAHKALGKPWSEFKLVE